MWSRKELKKNSKGALKRNYWGIVITCLLIAVIMGSVINPITMLEGVINPQSASSDNVAVADTANADAKSNTEIVNEFFGGIGITDNSAKRWTNGALAVVANNSEGAKSVIYGIINTINQIAFKDRLSPKIIIGIGVLVSLFILIFLKNVLRVGFCRYLLEVRVYSRTKINRLMFPWHVKRSFKIVKIIFVKMIYLLLWDFTVIGGIIKRYSYRMVPFIAAENPDMSAAEVIKLSRQMMNGNKWRAFVLDWSFIPWELLNMLTFNLLKILFISPYTELTDAELYMALRQKAKADGIKNSDMLCDMLLEAEPSKCEYPVEEYLIPPAAPKHWAHADYNRNYGIVSLILIFFAFSMIGWIWEVSLHLFKDGVFVNRGVLLGPWLPIYGTGGVMVLVLLKKIRSKPALTFIVSMVLCGAVEYFTSWYLEKTHGMKWWDYSGYFLNLNGRICLEGLLVFAFGCCAAIYLIAPALDDLFNRIPKNIRTAIAGVLVAAFLCDQTYSHFIPNSGKGITDYN